MRKVEINILSMEDLTDEQKEKLVLKYNDINVDYDWWDCTCADAGELGIAITEFDDYRCKIKFIENYPVVIDNIIRLYEEDSELYQIAKHYELEHRKIICQHEADFLSYSRKDWDEVFYDSGIFMFADIEKDSKYDLEEYFRLYLRKGYEYLTSDEAILESLEDYEFTEDLEIWRG